MKEDCLKVLHINCNYMTTALHKTMTEHLDRYTDNRVFCPIRRRAKAVLESGENVTVSECFGSIDRVLYFKKQNRIYSEVLSAYKVFDFNIIHAYTLFTDGNVAMRLSKRFGIPYIVTIRDTDINYFMKYKPYLISLGIKIMLNASKVIFLSEAYRDRMFNVYVPKKKSKLLLKKSIIIPNGIDDFWHENRYIEKDLKAAADRIAAKDIRLICVGKVEKRKNIPILTDVVGKLNDNGWNASLEVVGRKVDQNDFNIINANKFTTYREPMDKEHLIHEYRKNDIFVLASHTETFGLVYAEAMTQGLPVIYTKGQGFDGQFKEGTVGYHVNDKSVEDIYDAVIRITEDYESLCGNCLELSGKFLWDDITSLYRNIYLEIRNMLA